MRLAGSVLAITPALLALAFAPCFNEPFSAPKSALFFLLTGVAASAAIAGGATLVRRGNVLDLALCVFVGVSWVSAILSAQRHIAFDGVFWVTAGALLFLAARIVASHSRLLLGIACAGVAVALVALLQYALGLDLFALFGARGPSVGRMRLYATLGNPNYVAAFIAASLPALFPFVWRRGRSALIAVIAVGCCCVAVALTGSRAGLVAVAVAVTVYVTARRKRAALLAIPVAMAAIVLAGVSPQNSRPVGDALQGRLAIWRVAVEEPRSLLLGTGPSTFAYHYPERLGRAFARANVAQFTGLEQHAHNDLVEFASDVGLPGTFTFVLLLGWWCSRLLPRRADPALAASMAGVASLLVVALFDFPLHRAECWALLWLWMAVPCAEEKVETHPTLVSRSAAAALLVATVAVAAPPLVSSYWTMRGVGFEEVSEYGAAEGAYRKALRWHSHPDAAFGRVRALAFDACYADALQASDMALNTLDEPELWLLRVRILRASGDKSRAVLEADAAGARFPYSVHLHDEGRILRQN